LKLRIYYIGKDKKNHFSDVEQLYMARIKRYLPLEVIQLPAKKYSSSLSAKEVQDLEGQIFEKAMTKEKNCILLDEAGKSMYSKKFASFMENKISRGGHSIAFFIGGAYGFSDKLKKSGVTLLSLSSLTMAHHLARIVLLEQIYRSFTIINNEPYHNA